MRGVERQRGGKGDGVPFEMFGQIGEGKAAVVGSRERADCAVAEIDVKLFHHSLSQGLKTNIPKPKVCRTLRSF